MEGGEGVRALFGQVDQIGIVVRDVDAAVEKYARLGIGPFKVRTVSRPDGQVRGQLSPYQVKVAHGHSGAVELELVQVLEGRTIHSEFLESRGEGLHHLGFFVDDLDASIALAKERGIGVLQSSVRDGRGFAYLDTEAEAGVVLEVIRR